MTPSKPTGTYSPDWADIAMKVKRDAGWKCERCGHGHDPGHGYALTVHHLDGDKANNQRWNLAALCQRCHLSIQGKVIMAQGWMLEHSDWMVPHVVGMLAAIRAGDYRPR